ncbi:MAG: hypothetical protein ACE5G9_10785 [Nitrospinales bacterium]
MGRILLPTPVTFTSPKIDTVENHLLKKNIKGVMEWKDKNIEFQTVELHPDIDWGVRGEGVKDWSKPYSLVAGDSFVFGANLRWKETLPRLLQKETGTQFVNIAEGAHGPIEEAYKIKNAVQTLNPKPKQVIWCYFEGNDLRSLQSEMGTGFFFLRGWLHKYSFTYRLVKLVVFRGGGKQFAEYKKYFISTTSGEQMRFSPSVLKLNLPKEDTQNPDFAEKEFQFLGQLIRDVAELCAQQSVRLTIVSIPFKEQVYYHKIVKDFPEWKGYDLYYQTRRLEEIARKTNVSFISLLEPFLDISRRESDLYFKDDDHWSRKGARYAASILGKNLKRLNPERTKTLNF